MAGFTNIGKQKALEYMTGRVARPANFYVALVTAANTPGVATVEMSNLTQIAIGNGYANGGYALANGATDFDASGNAANYGYVQAKDVVWTASGGDIPASGDGARWAVLTDDNANIANRAIVAYWDLVSNRTVSNGQALTLQNCELRITES